MIRTVITGRWCSRTHPHASSSSTHSPEDPVRGTHKQGEQSTYGVGLSFQPADQVRSVTFFGLQIHPPPLASVPRTKLVVRRSAPPGQPGAERSAAPPTGSLAAVTLLQPARPSSSPPPPPPFSASLCLLLLLTSWPRTRPPWRPRTRPLCSAATATAAASAGCWPPALRTPRRGASARSGSPRCRTGCRPCT
jgi:hypothetical protein|uniref:Uncharacterized protein n=1 Tax=Zea mays TaxID=4577 RepID=C4J2C5_MAIZE|nr:unknown [Zea mays]